MNKEITFTYKFSIFSEEEYDVNIITKELSITPSEAWMKGDLIREGLLRKQSCWAIVSEEIISYTFEESFFGFLTTLDISIPNLIGLAKKEDLKIQVDSIIKIYEGKTMPGIHLSSDTIKILSGIKCSVDFDIFDYRESSHQA